MKALLIVPCILAVAGCHGTRTIHETPEACAARFAGMNNNASRGWIPTYTFDLSAAESSSPAEARLDKLAKPGTSVTVAVHQGSEPSLKQIEGESVANGAQAVARGCEMESHGVKFVGLKLSVPNSPNQGS